MPQIAESAFADIVSTADGTLTVQAPGWARLEFPVGTTVWEGRGACVSFDIGAGTYRLTAVQGGLFYDQAPDMVRNGSGIILYQHHKSQAGLTGTLTETTLCTIPLPPLSQIISPSGSLEIEVVASMTASVNAKTLRPYLNGVNCSTKGVAGSSPGMCARWLMGLRGSYQSQFVTEASGGTISAFFLLTQDLTKPSTLTIAGTLALSTETLTVESVTVTARG